VELNSTGAMPRFAGQHGMYTPEPFEFISRYGRDMP
jgi:hypothetical protein